MEEEAVADGKNNGAAEAALFVAEKENLSVEDFLALRERYIQRAELLKWHGPLEGGAA